MEFSNRTVLILIGLLLLGRLIGMAEVPLTDATEARYGEISRKMAELNDWLTPWFDYNVPYWGKPPLAFWLTAISFKLFGVNEFAARLPHLAISLLIVGLIAWFAARRDRNAALPTVALMSASFLYLIAAGAVMTDIELVFGTTLAMAGFWLALEDMPDARAGAGVAQSAWCSGLLFFGGLVLGLLAKGPVAMVLTGAPLLLWTAYNRRWLDVWRRLPWILGISFTLLISLPWYLLAEHRTPGFLEYFVVGEHLHRFLTPGWDGDRYGHAHIFPIGTIWGFALIGTLPWSLLLPLAAWRWRKKIMASTTMMVAKGTNVDAAAPEPPPNNFVGSAVQSVIVRSDERAWQGYLLTWAITPLLFFTAARNIIFTYVLPGLPAAAVLVGGWLACQHRQGHATNRWLSAGLLITLLVMGSIIMYISRSDEMDRRSMKTMLSAYDQHRAKQTSLSSPLSRQAMLAQSGVPLIFIRSRPFSAEFYSHGKAIRAAGEDEAWRRIGVGAGYVATRWADAFVASAAPKGAEPLDKTFAATTPKIARVVDRIGRYGHYDLLFVAAQ